MKNALVAIALVLAVVLLMWGGMHVMLRPVNPSQTSPEGHFTSACWACHFVSESADIVDE